MILSALTLVGGTMLSKWVFESGRLPPSWDILRCVVNIPEDVQRVGDPQEGEMTMMAIGTKTKYNATDEMNGRVNPALSLGSDSDEEASATAKAATVGISSDGSVKKRLVGEIISPPPITSPKKHDMTKL